MIVAEPPRDMPSSASFDPKKPVRACKRCAIPPLFSVTEVGHAVRIEDGKVWVNSVLQSVQWSTVKHADGLATIASVDQKIGGNVSLNNGTKFSNFAFQS